MNAETTRAMKVASNGASGNTLIVGLDTRGTGRELLGGKGESLTRLRQAGMPVPDGFILTTDAYKLFLRENGISSPDSAEEIRNGILSDSIRTRIEEGTAQLQASLFAVRSSAIAEDGGGASFAGQYRTVLNCSSIEELCDAVVACWASAASTEAREYSQQKTGTRDQAMALIIQEMVPADSAGVIFTAHPVSGDRHSLLVNSVRGLGDRLVSGEVTPEECILAKEGSVETDSDILSAKELARLKEYALRIEEAFGEPQDIEWAIANGEVYILQARPITTISDIEPIPMTIDVPTEGRWERDDIHHTRPISPLFASIYGPIFKDSTRKGFGTFGTLIEGAEARFIGGHTYIRIIPPMGKEGPPPPPFLLKLLLKLAPPLRRKVQTARKAIREDLAGKLIKQWHQEWRPRFSTYLDNLKGLDLSSLDRQGLQREYHQVLETLREADALHFTLFPPHFIAVSDVMFFCEEELGWPNDKTTRLLSGLSIATSSTGRALADLAQEARKRPSVMNLLATSSSRTYEDLKQTDPSFTELLDKYLREWGLQVPGFDIDQPTHYERPELVLDWLAGQINQEYDPSEIEQKLKNQRLALIDEAREALRNKPEKQEEFERMLSRLELAYPLRDDNGLLELSIISGLRLITCEIGKRMAKHDHLAHEDDIFFLERDEVTEWLENPADQKDLARRRKGERLWAASQSFPYAYGPEPDAPPDLSVLPPELQRVMRGLLWEIENDIQPQLFNNSEGTISGTGASAGVYTGPARIVRDETEFTKVQPGDVLVCTMTNPAWATLFSNIGGLVVDAGGLLSHPAIIAREYGIPAVLATGNGTELLQDGDLIRVDGTTGTVTPLLDKER